MQVGLCERGVRDRGFTLRLQEILEELDGGLDRSSIMCTLHMSESFEKSAVRSGVDEALRPRLRRVDAECHENAFEQMIFDREQVCDATFDHVSGELGSVRRIDQRIAGP